MFTKFVLILGFFLSPQLAYASGMEDSLRECSKDHSHIEMRECLLQQETDSAADLAKAEKDFRDNISKGDQEPEDVDSVKKTFDTGVKTFKEYRHKQCEFFVAIASGGNGADDLRMACYADLDRNRLEQLQYASHAWK